MVPITGAMFFVTARFIAAGGNGMTRVACLGGAAFGGGGAVGRRCYVCSLTRLGRRLKGRGDGGCNRAPACRFCIGDNPMLGNGRVECPVMGLFSRRRSKVFRSAATSASLPPQQCLGLPVGIAHGLAQMGSVGRAATIERFPRSTPDLGARAATGNRVGGDLGRVISRETKRAKEGA